MNREQSEHPVSDEVKEAVERLREQLRDIKARLDMLETEQQENDSACGSG